MGKCAHPLPCDATVRNLHCAFCTAPSSQPTASCSSAAPGLLYRGEGDVICCATVCGVCAVLGWVTASAPSQSTVPAWTCIVVSPNGSTGVSYAENSKEFKNANLTNSKGSTILALTTPVI